MFFLGNGVGTVVVELVIIPGDEPRTSRVHLLEILVAAILGVARTVLIESLDFRAMMLPYAAIHS